ncbi:MAG: hypothetical protein ACOY32_00795, partial [Thermodesulfobacteriota bacterium]
MPPERKIQNLKIVPFFRLKEPPNPNLPIPPKTKQKFFLVASVGNMSHISWNEVSIRSRHGDRLLQLYFSAQKAVSKAQKQDKFQLYL